VKEAIIFNEKEVSFIKQMIIESPATFEKVSLQINDILKKKK